MKRIFLEKISDNTYEIRDILDGKKLGKITKTSESFQYKLKSKYKGKFIETEAYLQLETDTNMTFTQVYENFITQINQHLGVNKPIIHPLYCEPTRLKQHKKDVFKRKVYLHPAAINAWGKMKKAANSQSIQLQIISAFRSLDYQKGLIENKLAKGIAIEDILKVNTLPGYSEHHTGCAIDIGSPKQAVLEEDFENSPAFAWLQANAINYDFYLSYPKNNTTGICYEPWHWCYRPKLRD